MFSIGTDLVNGSHRLISFLAKDENEKKEVGGQPLRQAHNYTHLLQVQSQALAQREREREGSAESRFNLE